MCAALPFGLVAFCTAEIASSYVGLYINTWYTKKIIGYGFKDQLQDLLPILGNCLIMGAICMSVQLPFDNNIVKLAIGIPIGIIYFILSSRLFNKEQFNEVIEILAPRIPMLRRFSKNK